MMWMWVLHASSADASRILSRRSALESPSRMAAVAAVLGMTGEALRGALEAVGVVPGDGGGCGEGGVWDDEGKTPLPPWMRQVPMREGADASLLGPWLCNCRCD